MSKAINIKIQIIRIEHFELKSKNKAGFYILHLIKRKDTAKYLIKI